MLSSTSKVCSLRFTLLLLLRTDCLVIIIASSDKLTERDALTERDQQNESSGSRPKKRPRSKIDPEQDRKIATDYFEKLVAVPADVLQILKSLCECHYGVFSTDEATINCRRDVLQSKDVRKPNHITNMEEIGMVLSRYDYFVKEKKNETFLSNVSKPTISRWNARGKFYSELRNAGKPFPNVHVRPMLICTSKEAITS